METLFEQIPDDPEVEICEVCWEDEGFHFRWCPRHPDNDTFDFSIEEEMQFNEDF